VVGQAQHTPERAWRWQRTWVIRIVGVSMYLPKIHFLNMFADMFGKDNHVFKTTRMKRGIAFSTSVHLRQLQVTASELCMFVCFTICLLHDMFGKFMFACGIVFFNCHPPPPLPPSHFFAGKGFDQEEPEIVLGKAGRVVKGFRAKR
jgi:hypothetical protein